MQREGFGRVCKGYGTFTGGVEHFEEIHARRDHGHSLFARRVIGIDPEGEARPEQSDRQEGERGQQQVSPAEGVDGEYRGQGKDPVQDTRAHGGQQRRLDGVARIGEDGGGIVGNDVDTTELLHEHDDPTGQRRPAIASHGKEFHEHGEEVFSLVDLALNLDERVCVVEVTRGLQVGWPEGAEGRERLVDTVMLDQPTRRLGAEIHLRADDDRQDDGRTEHETPRQVVRQTHEGYAHDVTYHDTERGPRLPHHNEGAPDRGW